jgi:hypothetical protein
MNSLYELSRTKVDAQRGLAVPQHDCKTLAVRAVFSKKYRGLLVTQPQREQRAVSSSARDRGCDPERHYRDEPEDRIPHCILHMMMRVGSVDCNCLMQVTRPDQ